MLNSVYIHIYIYVSFLCNFISLLSLHRSTCVQMIHADLPFLMAVVLDQARRDTKKTGFTKYEAMLRFEATLKTTIQMIYIYIHIIYYILYIICHIYIYIYIFTCEQIWFAV